MIEKYWKFKVFISDTGRNEFKVWIDALPKEAKATIHETMDQIEIRQILGPPFARKLEGCRDIWEIKAKSNNIQYRPLFCVKADGIIILLGATKTGDKRKTKFNPVNAKETAKKRCKLVFQDGRYIDDYRRT